MLKRPPDFARLFQGAFVPNEMSEDCLYVNVWSPSSGDKGGRPVMVWLHGGGFAVGAGSWGWSDGTNLAGKHDVVVVSLNHRLNIFGHLYLSDIGGPKYANSSNIGMLDIIAALEWVHENIAAFGGDPGNITIFGESGGGSKVSVLMAMPAAQGLFHRAINMSGPGVRMLSREQATKTSLAVLGTLGIRDNEIEQLHHVPAEKLLAAVKVVAKQAGLSYPDWTWKDGSWYHMFDPVVDERTLPTHPFDPAASQISADVPMLIGTTRDEEAWVVEPDIGTLDEAGLRAKLKTRGIEGVEADHLIRAYRATRPNAPPADIFSAISTDLEYRMDAITMAERKSALERSSVYMYLFAWESPAFDGRFKSSHAFELPFVFDNIDMAPGLWGASPDPRGYELASRISQTWVAFARTGNPNRPDLPQWKPYTVTDRATMVLNYSCELVNDPRREDRLADTRIGVGT